MNLKHWAVVVAVGVPSLAGSAFLVISFETAVPAVVQAAAEARTASEFAAKPKGLRTVRLEVDGMYCASCPYIVQAALLRTAGVIEAKVSFGRAIVTYDQSKTDAAALTWATTQYGYPSRLASALAVVR